MVARKGKGAVGGEQTVGEKGIRRLIKLGKGLLVQESLDSLVWMNLNKVNKPIFD